MRCAANGMGISTEMGSSSATSAFLANERRVCPFGGAHECVGSKGRARSVAVSRDRTSAVGRRGRVEVRRSAIARNGDARKGDRGKISRRSGASADPRVVRPRTHLLRGDGEAGGLVGRERARGSAEKRARGHGGHGTDSARLRGSRVARAGRTRAKSGSFEKARLDFGEPRRARRVSVSRGDDRAFVCYLFHDARLRPRRIRARARPPGDLPSARRARCPRWPRCRPRRTSSRSGRATCP